MCTLNVEFHISLLSFYLNKKSQLDLFCSSGYDSALIEIEVNIEPHQEIQEISIKSAIVKGQSVICQ